MLFAASMRTASFPCGTVFATADCQVPDIFHAGGIAVTRQRMGKKMAIFDLRETIIPFSLLQICNYFKKMKPGEAVEILCCDENIAKDLRCILPRLEYEIIFSAAPETKRTEFLICLKKLGPSEN